jgi:replicative DNA helicase Mcm
MASENIKDKEEKKDERKTEMVARFKEFIRKKYYKDIVKAANEGTALFIDFRVLEKFSYELGELLLSNPEFLIEVVDEAVSQIDLPSVVRIRFHNLPELTHIRDLRSQHLKKFVYLEGTVRKASEIRPEIEEIIWECPECGVMINKEKQGTFIGRPFQCDCGNRKGFKEAEKRMIDARWIVIEEPFELTEGDRPSQVTVLLTEDLVSPDGRRMTDPGNRLKITGTLKDVPRGKIYSAKLDFFVEANHVEPTAMEWQSIEINKEDEKRIKELAKDPKVYDMFVDSLAPSLYGLREIKESIILQMFGGVPRHLKDGTHVRGDIHVLLIGDPAAGKSQLLKLVPDIVPRGRYVSGKGVTGAGLTATVSKDEQFMGGWVLEAGALVLANKGLLSIDEFEKMNPDDQVAMHEALEQGTISIAKASIVATLPAKTSVLAGGNPKFSRFDPYLPISKQITLPDTILSRFDLKFAMRDVPHGETDKLVVDHVLNTHHDADYEGAMPKLDAEFIRKYIAYTKDKTSPVLTEEAGKIMKNFYIRMRKKAEGGGGAVAITLRQFEALMRLAEASAKVQLQPKVRKEDAQRAIKLMRYSLHQLGFDPDTGQIDVDRSEGGTSSSERGRIRIVLDIVNELSQKKKEILVDDIRSRARQDGVDDVDEVLERLKTQGLLFEPSPGYVQKV